MCMDMQRRQTRNERHETKRWSESRAARYPRFSMTGAGIAVVLLILLGLGLVGGQTVLASETPTPCPGPPVAVPTPPAETPGYAQEDLTTGLHVTGTAQEIDLESYRLEVTGKVENPLSLSFDELRCLPKITDRPTLICPGFFQDVAVWSGASLKAVLEQADVQEDAKSIRLKSADGYSSTVPLEDALTDENFLAYEWEGEPVPILHGFPVRAVFPKLPGNRWVKWLIEIEVY
ncbi:molybdopterin-dependent oxidoreductase [candidate division KSB3 bacterium]|uniref:Molybdopterin-dependent oxidoreductase n=1 Tax=candidate division KSB3 bacterium TaxID=2044937 RepID=A0A9D5JSD9_9BACT|nr:molybdopterin-dependent oxidoreductase [candidate division KSB3 bacterium]MBD3323360.1 molybdopterin-dependent oxidoreductase [candidate division KSB3 bacterium]